jgi:hypothetical protein
VFVYGVQNWLQAAYLAEWVACFGVSFVEMILWFVAVAGIQHVFVDALETFKLLTLVFYLIPIVFLILNAFFEQAWITDGTLAHLIVDCILWLFVYLSHLFELESTKWDYTILGASKIPSVTDIDDKDSPRAQRNEEIE